MSAKMTDDALQLAFVKLPFVDPTPPIQIASYDIRGALPIESKYSPMLRLLT